VQQAYIQAIEGQLANARAQTSPKRATVVGAATALMNLKIPYVFGGTWASNKSFDCSALVQEAYKAINITLKRVSKDQANMGVEVAYESLLPGDLLFFDTNKDGVVNHVGMWIGDGKMLHTNSPAEGIHIEDVATKYKKWLTGCRRLISD
jgi:cell wall-associated NlpC family hydrolase